jgi:hypothetical protein
MDVKASGIGDNPIWLAPAGTPEDPGLCGQVPLWVGGWVGGITIPARPKRAAATHHVLLADEREACRPGAAIAVEDLVLRDGGGAHKDVRADDAADALQLAPGGHGRELLLVHPAACPGPGAGCWCRGCPAARAAPPAAPGSRSACPPCPPLTDSLKAIDRRETPGWRHVLTVATTKRCSACSTCSTCCWPLLEEELAAVLAEEPATRLPMCHTFLLTKHWPPLAKASLILE